jgi:cellulose synthase/poly-beta-1,6-N-acetylglucosamine synthase-like glycosyltransferase
MEKIALILFWLLWSYSSLFAVLLFIFSIAGCFRPRDQFISAHRFCRMAVLIPAYKEDQVIAATVADALQQAYPREQFDVVVIADSLQQATLELLKKTAAILIPVQFAESTKAKAINRALEALPEDKYDGVVILDADNLLAPDFLQKINNALAGGSLIVQAHRRAKNLNTPLAILDAISEEINNHIFRRGHRVLGLSAALIGSGMGFDYAYYKNLMKRITAVGGFDKEIELEALKAGHQIIYLEDAHVFDEKVDTAENFTRQRKRWLAAQGHYFRQYFLDALAHLFSSGNVDYFNKALQMLQPPRILLAGLLFLMTLFSPLTGSPLIIGACALSLAVCAAALLLAIPRSFYNSRSLTALIAVPKGFMLMLAALVQSKGANRHFLHTEHKHTSPPPEESRS